MDEQLYFGQVTKKTNRSLRSERNTLKFTCKSDHILELYYQCIVLLQLHQGKESTLVSLMPTMYLFLIREEEAKTSPQVKLRLRCTIFFLKFPKLVLAIETADICI